MNSEMYSSRSWEKTTQAMHQNRCGSNDKKHINVLKHYIIPVRTTWPGGIFFNNKLERKLIVSRKHVTGVSGFTSTMVGAVMIAGSLYAMTEKVIWFVLALAVIILAYATICYFVEKKEYNAEERYTKE